MSSLRRWRQGQFHKWEAPGEEREGTWQGQRDSQYGPLGTLDTADGRVTFPLHAALLARLRLVRTGAYVLIRYTGPQTSKAGRIFKAFEVLVAAGAAVVDPSETGSGSA
jgi:hypothetical protein